MKLKYLYTKNQHLNFGFNKTAFNKRSKPQDVFYVKYGQCQRAPLDFRAEALIACRDIFNAYAKKPLYLCLSGGIDSEVMLEAFRYSRVPFKAIIAKFDGDKNIHDICWAIRYCEKHQIPYEFFDINIKDFFSSTDYKKIILDSQAVYPLLTTTMRLIQFVVEKKNGVPIIGSGEPLLQKDKNNKWLQIDTEPILSMYNFLIARNYPGVPGFFQWSPELVAAYFLDPTVIQLVSGKIVGTQTTQELKLKIYNNYFKIESRPKYYGFEKFAPAELELRKNLLKQFPGSETASALELSGLLAYMMAPLKPNKPAVKTKKSKR